MKQGDIPSLVERLRSDWKESRLHFAHAPRMTTNQIKNARLAHERLAAYYNWLPVLLDALSQRKDAVCPSCNGLNTSCPDGCGRDPTTGELDGSRLDAVGGGVPAGIVLVPREPTEAMIEAHYHVQFSGAREVWSAMLSAAPAYTPKTASSYDDAARERIARIVYDYQVSMGLDSEAAGEDAAGIADAILAALPTSDGAGETRSGFACPICGQETPHHHTPEVVNAYQNKRSRK